MYEWSRNEVIELESINEMSKNFDKLEQKIKSLIVKLKCDGKPLDELEDLA